MGKRHDKRQIGTQGTNGKRGRLGWDSKEAAAVAPPTDALSNLAGGGYADPNYVPPKTQSKKSTTQSKKSTRHRVMRAPRARTSRRFEQYSNPAFPYGYCHCCYYY